LGSPRAGNVTVRSLQRKNNPKITLTRRGLLPGRPCDAPRLDRIHLGLRFLASRVTPDFAAFITLAGAR